MIRNVTFKAVNPAKQSLPKYLQSNINKQTTLENSKKSTHRGIIPEKHNIQYTPHLRP